MVIMTKNELVKYFKGKNIISRDELYEFFLKNEPNLKKNTFAWRVHKLTKKGIIKIIGRGIYSLKNKDNYFLQLSNVSVKVSNHIAKSYSDLTYCISNSNWINEFTTHQYSSNFTIVEVEKEFLESVFFSLREKFKNVFLKPSKTEFDRYISDLGKAIILIPFITRAPIQKLENKKFLLPTIEKLIVDIFTKNIPYFFLPKSEVDKIIKNVFRNYNVNQTTLLAYAARRGKKNEIQNFLIEKKLIEARID